jgi:PPOX class probable F420-dependent enzyme
VEPRGSEETTMSVTTLSPHAEERLRREPIVWLSSVRPDGRPHLVPVWFLWDGGTVLIFSKPDQKIRNIRQQPAVVLALEAADEGEDIVIIEGRAALSEGDVTAELPAYAEKYARLLPEIGSSAEKMAREYTQVIRVTPTRVRAWGGE